LDLTLAACVQQLPIWPWGTRCLWRHWPGMYFLSPWSRCAMSLIQEIWKWVLVLDLENVGGHFFVDGDLPNN